MENQELVVYSSEQSISLTARDIAAMGFRHRKAFIICFFAVLLGTALVAATLPLYESHTEILVRMNRVDPVVTAAGTNPAVSNTTVTEEMINSEAELIKSDDVLREVVVKVGLDKNEGSKYIFWKRTPEEAIAKALAKLRGGVRVDVLPKTNIFKVSYSSSDPKLAAKVLTVLDEVYLEHHKAVNRPAGQYAFFDKQVQDSQATLSDAEAKLQAFSHNHGTPNSMMARDISLQKVNDFNFTLGQTRTEIAEAQRRVTALEQLQKTTNARMTTQVHSNDDAGTIQQMKTTLLNLQLKQSDMASKYQPDYPPLVEVNKEIAETEAAIAGQKPLQDITTDQNPTYNWIDDEMAKDKTELQGAQAKAGELESVINQNMDSIRKLETSGLEEGALIRNAKAAETNYLLYLQKREEARIDDALDTSQLVNVAIQETPAVPVYPSQSPWLFALVGILLAVTISAAVVFVRERLDGSFRTPTEVESILHLPVLAAVPATGNGFSLNGNGASSRHLPVDVLRETRN
ncbi:MAG: Wzz/FepE/Etk N-terminal domain-containing protein [Terriglobales bacterium]|jgi:uncharacterized protein involved in exopolysaccharide biosynthesis